MPSYPALDLGGPGAAPTSEIVVPVDNEEQHLAESVEGLRGWLDASFPVPPPGERS